MLKYIDDGVAHCCIGQVHATSIPALAVSSGHPQAPCTAAFTIAKLPHLTLCCHQCRLLTFPFYVLIQLEITVLSTRSMVQANLDGQ